MKKHTNVSPLRAWGQVQIWISMEIDTLESIIINNKNFIRTTMHRTLHLCDGEALLPNATKGRTNVPYEALMESLLVTIPEGREHQSSQRSMNK